MEIKFMAMYSNMTQFLIMKLEIYIHLRVNDNMLQGL